MDVLFRQPIGEDDEGMIARRQVIRAISKIRRQIEDERGINCNFLDVRVDALINLVADLGLETTEAIEALGSEIVRERLWVMLIPELDPARWKRWHRNHRGSTLAILGTEDLRP